MIGRLFVAALPAQHDAEIIELYDLAELVTKFAVQGQGLPEMIGGPPVLGLARQNDTEVPERAGLAATVAEFAVDGQGLPQLAARLLMTSFPVGDCGAA